MSPCQIWPGPKDKNGYGLTRVNRVTARVNRVIWEKAYGTITDGRHVLHRCDNPSCVNIGHMFLGTHQENMQDMVLKGRSHKPIGELNGRAKLALYQVEEIRRIYATGEFSQHQLARMFNTSRSTIAHITRGYTWASH